VKPGITEIMNIKLAAGSRTLYIDLKQDSGGGRFLSISEVQVAGLHERSRILVDEEFLPDLHRALGAVLELLGRKEPKKSYTVSRKRCDHPRAYEPWTEEEQERLQQGYAQGEGVHQLAEQLARAPTAVLSRLYQLGMIKPSEEPRWDSLG